MGKAKSWWYYPTVAFIRVYPKLIEKKKAIQSASLVANYNSTGGHSTGDTNRTTENISTRSLSIADEHIIEAVDKAIALIKKRNDYADVLYIIKMVDWKRTHNIDGVALALHMSRNTAQNKRADFIKLVASCYGFK